MHEKQAPPLDLWPLTTTSHKLGKQIVKNILLFKAEAKQTEFSHHIGNKKSCSGATTVNNQYHHIEMIDLTKQDRKPGVFNSN